MHHQACRLVDHDEVFVLEQDLQRNRLRLWLGNGRRKNADSDLILYRDRMAGFGNDTVVHFNLARLDQRLQDGTRLVRPMACTNTVEPVARIRFVGRKGSHLGAALVGIIHRRSSPFFTGEQAPAREDGR